MQAASPSSFDPAGAGGVLLGALLVCIGLGVLFGWLAGSIGIGVLIGAVAGILVGIVAVYWRYDIRNLIRTLLERTGTTVHDAPNGREGLREFHAWRPDLVILDVNMPELDGWAVLERIRDMSEVPVLMLTARGEELERVRGLQAGADDYVVKPFGKQELVARVQALVRRASRGSQEQEADAYSDAYLSIDWAQARVAVGDREVQL